jgi:long-chain acyl-CoA synthetase
LFNIFPLPQQSEFRRSFRHAGEAIDRGYSVLVFPEGRRSADGSPQPFMSGAGLLWNQLNVPALPVRLDGLGELKVERSGWFRSGKISARAGELLPPKPQRSPADSAEVLRTGVFGPASTKVLDVNVGA